MGTVERCEWKGFVTAVWSAGLLIVGCGGDGGGANASDARVEPDAPVPCELSVSPAATWLIPEQGGSVWGVGGAATGDGSFYVLGTFADFVDVGTTSGAPVHLAFANGGAGFLARYSTAGEVTWAAVIGADTPHSVATGGEAGFAGRVAVVGRYENGASFGSGANEVQFVGTGGFLAVYSASGSLEYAKRAVLNAVPLSTLVRPDGSVILLALSDEIAFGAPVVAPDDPEAVELPTPDGSDALLAAFDASGTLQWVKTIGGTGNLTPSRLANDSSGAFFVGGRYNGQAIFGAGEGNETTLNALGAEIFLARYQVDGQVAWVARVRGAGDLTALGADGNGGVYLGGPMEGSLLFGAGEAQETSLSGDGAYLGRIANDGTTVWATRIVGGTGVSPTHVDARADGALVSSMSFGSKTLDPDGSSPTLIDGEQNGIVQGVGADGTVGASVIIPSGVANAVTTRGGGTTVVFGTVERNDVVFACEPTRMAVEPQFASAGFLAEFPEL